MAVRFVLYSPRLANSGMEEIMLITRKHWFPVGGALTAVALVSGCFSVRAGDIPLTVEQKEQFLRTAQITKTHDARKGVTGTLQVTLSDGTVTHDASVQTIDEYKAKFESSDGRTEMNFKDSWKFNVAAWKLSRLLGIDDMVPPSVERKYSGGKNASFTWWIEDVVMDEAERTKKKVDPPDSEKWNNEMYVVRVFDQLIYNTDRNLQNLLIDKQWRIWMIDHSRAFRMYHDLKGAKDLVRCDRSLLAKLKALDQETLTKELMPYLNKEEIKGLLLRRDRIVKFFDEKGESALYDRPKRM